jgi:thiol-disulfide isomerase/thioredoxin
LFRQRSVKKHAGNGGIYKKNGKINMNYSQEIRKMRVVFIVALMLMSIGNLFAQEKGIHFEQGLTWQQIQAKAKEEGKYIFVDCYATWCGPCKVMDQRTYPDSLLGAYVNDSFISVKVQMDSAKNDNDYVHSWRTDAQTLEKVGKIHAYPSFLFFNADGKLLYKELGFHTSVDFLKTTMNATDPDKQSYSLLDKYRNGTLYDATVLGLILKMLKGGDKEAAIEVAIPFIHNDLIKRSSVRLFSRDNLSLMNMFLSGSDDPVFVLFKNHEDRIDSIEATGFAFSKLFDIIKKEDLNTKLWSGMEPLTSRPDWKELTGTLRTKYGDELAGRAILYERVAFYTGTKQWSELAGSTVELMEKYGKHINGAQVNDMVYTNLFLHNDDRNVLVKAASWMKSIIDKYPNNVVCLDTYANVLYKLGNTKDALVFEEKANRMATRADDRKDTATALANMKAGKPTWGAN